MKGGGHADDAAHDLFRGGVENEVVIPRRAAAWRAVTAFYFM